MEGKPSTSWLLMRRTERWSFASLRAGLKASSCFSCSEIKYWSIKTKTNHGA